jgi:hypothetical protein
MIVPQAGVLSDRRSPEPGAIIPAAVVNLPNSKPPVVSPT